VKVCPACSREYADEHERCRDDGVVLVRVESAAVDRAQDLIGTVVDGRFRIERIVGRGGMGTIYACRHVVVGKAFAIKVLRGGIERSEEVLQRFIREAQAANAVQSRHICETHDFGQLPTGALYVVMELLQGISLTRALREKRLARREIKHVFIQVAETLDKAHRAGIVHRDLKPDNVVLVEDEGDPYFVKLVDFGIAKMVQSKASNLTETGVILGTPYYMSPEQARGDPIDHRSDIYALGVMMFRAFTGKLPFIADTAMGVLTRHLTEKPPLPSVLVGDIDAALERLILRCLEKRPIDRFQSMADVAEALRLMPDDTRSMERAYLHDETVDERGSSPMAGPAPSGRPRSGKPPPLPPGLAPHAMSEPTPTRVETPKSKAAFAPTELATPSPVPRAPPQPSPASARQLIPPLPPVPAVLAAPASAPIPLEMARPAQASPSGAIAMASQSPGVSHGPTSSGAAPLTGTTPMAGLAAPTSTGPSSAAPGFGAPQPPGVGGEPWAVLPPHMQGEAATDRGVVSSRYDTRRPAAQRTALAVMLAMGGAAVLVAVALVALRPSGGGSVAASGTATTTRPPPSAPSGAAPETSDAVSEGGAAPTPSASASGSASAATPPRSAPSGPGPLVEPTPEIRSPFDAP
jgi:serine/threonine-protein kinase